MDEVDSKAKFVDRATTRADLREWLAPFSGRRLLVESGKKGVHAIAVVRFDINVVWTRGLRTNSQVSYSSFTGSDGPLLPSGDE